MPEKYSKSKLFQFTKANLVDIILEWQDMPEPEPEVVVREVEKEVMVENNSDMSWPSVSEKHLVETLKKFRKSIINTLRPEQYKVAPGPPMTIEEATETILRNQKDQ